MSRRRSPACRGAAVDPADPARREDPIPAAWAAIIVADTVVAAQPPASSAAARLGRAAFRTEPAGAVASASSDAASSPTRIRPSRIATVAGTAPASRTAASDASATSRFCGYGSPWLISVDSSATTGRPPRSASATSGRTSSLSAIIRGPAPASRSRVGGPPRGGRPARRGGASRAGRGRPVGAERYIARKPASKASPAPVVSVAASGRRRHLESVRSRRVRGRAPSRRRVRA